MEIHMSRESAMMFKKSINDMIKATGRDEATVTRNFARDLCRKSIRYTPATRAGKDPIYVVVESGGKKIYVPRKEPGGGIAMRTRGGGLAKAGWSGCLTRLGVPPKSSGNDSGARKFSDVDKIQTLHGTTYIVTNEAPFISDFENGDNPRNRKLNIQDKAMRAVLSSADRQLKRMALKTAKQYGLA